MVKILQPTFRFPFVGIVIASLLFIAPLSQARRVGYRFSSKVEESEKKSSGKKKSGAVFCLEPNEDFETYLPNSFAIPSKEYDDARNDSLIDPSKYGFSQLRFFGFDKRPRSSKESFFITNNTDRTLLGIELSVQYLAIEGEELTARTLRIVCNVPSGATRKIDLDSWDRQQSFHYVKSKRGKADTTPFQIRFTPHRFYLQR